MIFARAWLQITIVSALCCASASVARAEDDTLSLAEAYRLALRQSEQFAIASRDVEAAEIRWRDTWSDIRPTITSTVAGAFQRRVTIGMTVFSPGQRLDVDINAQQPVFRKGFFSARDAGRYAYESANATLARQREQLARDVAQVYIDVVRTRAVVELSRGAVKRTTAQYDHALARVKAGNTLKTAELLADIDVKRAERQLVTAERDAGVAEAAFKRLVGRAAPAVLEAPEPPTPPALAGALETAKQRDDLQALGLRVREASARADAARGTRFWPRLDLLAGATYFQPEVLDRTVGWQVVGLLTIPILQSGRESNDIALRQNEARIAQLQLDQQREVLTQEVETAWVVVETATRGAELAKKQLKTATDHYTLVDKQFRLGAITFLEVTNATAALAEAELAHEIAKMDRVQATYDYLFAIGALDLERQSTSSP